MEELLAELRDKTPKEVVTLYAQARAKCEDIDARAKKAKEPLEELQTACEKALFIKKVELGVKSFAVDGIGTIGWAAIKKCKVSDYEALVAFAKEYPGYEFFEQKIREPELKKFMADNPDIPLEFAEISTFDQLKFTKAKV